ncbi:Chromo domain-containing protein 2 [Fusarium oxysporum f. sp. phaseoli]
MPPAPSDDKSLNQGKFTALTQGSRRSISDSQLLVVNLDQVETPKGTPTGESDKEDGELEDGLFIVETIKNHATDKNGNLMFQVKWKGFESKKDLTWEPEDNLKYMLSISALTLNFLISVLSQGYRATRFSMSILTR